MIILLDFDGTCIYQLPEPGCTLEEVPRVVEVLNKLVRNDHKLILWTSRNDSPNNPYNYYADGTAREETSLSEAKRWFYEKHIPLSGVNEFPDETQFVGNSRKIYGEVLIDDISIGTPLIYDEVDYISYYTGDLIRNYKTWCVDWFKVEELLKMKGLL